MIRSTLRHLAAVSASGRRRRWPVDRDPDSWRNSLLLYLATCLCIFLLQNKKILISFFFIIFNYIYFEAIQAAVFYKKNASKMFKSSLFMFLDFLVSCDKNKKLSLGKIDYRKVSSKIRWNESLSPQKPPKIVDNFMFLVLLKNIFLMILWGHFRAIFWRFWDHIISTVLSKLKFLFFT